MDYEGDIDLINIESNKNFNLNDNNNKCKLNIDKNKSIRIDIKKGSNNNNNLNNIFNNNNFDIINNKLDKILYEMTNIKSKLNYLENIFNEKKEFSNNQSIYKNNIPKNPFDLSNIYNNTSIDTKEIESKLDTSIDNSIEIDFTEKPIKHNKNKILRKYYFIFRGTNKDKIVEIYNDIKKDKDFDNYIILKETKIFDNNIITIEIENNEPVFYILLKFKENKTINMENMEGFKYLGIGSRASNAIEELKKFSIVIFNHKNDCNIKNLNLKKLLN